jgi:pimeloyl-ACP methyl ester carboxylesterase
VALTARAARVRKVLLVFLIIAIGLSAAGALYQAISVRRESTRYRPSGRLVDVGGRRLHLVCIGQGEPTVVFEPSGFGGAGSGSRARAEIARSNRVCSYDRMGMGWSDPGPDVISAGVLSDDLEHLLDRAGLRPPYVLVASSVGGLTAELFARRHPDRVAGLVFLDAAYSGVLDRFIHEWSPLRTMEACATKVAARLGVLRLIDPLGLRRQPPDLAAANIAALYRVQPMATFCGMVRALPETARELTAAPPLRPGMPLTVLTAESDAELVPPAFQAAAESVRQEWRPLQLALAQRSSRGTWRVVPGSTHLLANTQPHAVASAVFELLSQAGR